MDENQNSSIGIVPHDAEKVENDSEPFRTVPNDSESFGSVPQKEKTEQHTLTVRQVTRMFEDAGAARTERSVVNWCQPNKHGVSRLDCYFEPNERRYFITKESVDRAIEEELAKTSITEKSQPGSESFGNVPHDQPTHSAPVQQAAANASNVPKESESTDALKAQIRELEKQLADSERLMEINRKVQDGMVTQLMHQLQTVQEDSMKRISRFARLTGRLETKLNGLLSAPSSHTSTAGVQPEEPLQLNDTIYAGLDDGVEDDERNGTPVQ